MSLKINHLIATFLLIFLSGCGGGGTIGEYADLKTQDAKLTGGATDSPGNSSDYVLSTDIPKATWVSWGTATNQNSTAGKLAAHSIETTDQGKTADGLFINIDGVESSEWQAKATQAVEAGMNVFLESSDTDEGRNAIRDFSLNLTLPGIYTNAALIHKNPETDSLSVQDLSSSSGEYLLQRLFQVKRFIPIQASGSI